MIPNREKCYYIVLKEIISSIKWKKVKNDSTFNYFNCLHWFRTKNKLDLLKNVCNNIYLLML